MNPFSAKRSMITAVVLSAAGLLCAPPAWADQTDDAFLATLERHAVVVTDANTSIAMGHAVCAGLDKGQTPIFVDLSLVKDTNLSAHEAGYFIGASVTSYCPQHKSELDGSAF
ncbi:MULTISPECIES: DUF732 domain-containing protein [Mycobacterium]|uniref:DUF732 domain-containing protein n=3 Tax=Mycobacterium TaxID=1763 RepID=X8CV57_MYCIT|nr:MULTISPECIES: DUF732 domain-containing protein [Mycobacterium]ETB45519.1 hypothetical protein O981_29295 [Mycobacterium avium 10-5560]EUA44287.1 hypothetical protein I552_4059 [Mycobacterium xenopi 3993]EUA59140.1 hypothetical protein I550_2286 [Mycobacterium intracellulare 1956]AFC43546.1 hypothetical protein OCU_23270 [Mycobacterium intracellulare ATCC 13950]APT11014.1 hypothetical protein BS641_12750 [Mycobacterium avium subsp. hominissuis]